MVKYITNEEKYQNYPDPLGMFRGTEVTREYYYGCKTSHHRELGICLITVQTHKNGVTTIIDNTTGKEAYYRRGFRTLAFSHAKTITARRLTIEKQLS